MKRWVRVVAVAWAMCLVLLPMRAWSERNDPVGVVVDFYDWYLHHRNHVTDHLAEQKSVMAGDLYRELRAAYSTPGEAVLDFDPFDNAQFPARRYQIGKVEVRDYTARVGVVLQLDPQGGSSLTVVLKQGAGRQWKISDIIYPATSDSKSFSLYDYLRKQLKS